MYMADYHLHTDNSFDSRSKMDNVCRQALKNGLKEICFTEHFSVNPALPTYGYLNFDRYFSEISACKSKFQDRLTIKAGLELCEPHLMMDDYKDVLKDHNLDFILGSVHNIDGAKLPDFVANHHAKTIYRRYFEEVYELVSHADIDILAHLDFIKRYSIEKLGNYNFKDVEDIIEAILQKAIERGIGIEINMAGHINMELREQYPKREILKLYKSLGGELLTIGSDAHLENMVGFQLDLAAEMAKEEGFDAIYTFENRKPKPIKLH